MTADEVPDEAAWAICPYLQFMLREDRSCKRCPAMLYYPTVERFGTHFCRHIANEAALACIEAMGE